MTAEQLSIPQDLIMALRSAGSVVVLTGAGVSAESGIPTFREAQTGLWATHRPEELATPGAFQKNPRLVWEWYTWRRELIAQSAPNPGHHALVEMERRIPNFTLITQNVDGLHRQAGSGAAAPLIELHGNIQRTRCFDCNHIAADWESDEIPPRCPECGGLLRPDVVWFGESLPAVALESAWKAAGSCQVFFSVGTSAVVEPAASLPYVAQKTRGVIVEINPLPTPLTPSADYSLQGPAGVILPQLVNLTWELPTE
jgi:NAD-dependent deacetylase